MVKKLGFKLISAFLVLLMVVYIVNPITYLTARADTQQQKVFTPALEQLLGAMYNLLSDDEQAQVDATRDQLINSPEDFADININELMGFIDDKVQASINLTDEEKAYITKDRIIELSSYVLLYVMPSDESLPDFTADTKMTIDILLKASGNDAYIGTIDYQDALSLIVLLINTGTGLSVMDYAHYGEFNEMTFTEYITSVSPQDNHFTASVLLNTFIEPGIQYILDHPDSIAGGGFESLINSIKGGFQTFSVSPSLLSKSLSKLLGAVELSNQGVAKTMGLALIRTYTSYSTVTDDASTDRSLTIAITTINLVTPSALFDWESSDPEVTVTNNDDGTVTITPASDDITSVHISGTVTGTGTVIDGDVIASLDIPLESPTITLSTTDMTNELTFTLEGGSDFGNGIDKIQYRIGDEGQWTDYLGEAVSVGENTTIYARNVDTNDDLIGIIGSKVVDNIDNENPSEPVLTPDSTSTTTGNVVVTINYPDDAVQRLYSIDGGITFLPYVDGVTISSNLTVIAKAIDSAGNESTAELAITNIDTTTILEQKTSQIEDLINDSLNSGNQNNIMDQIDDLVNDVQDLVDDIQDEQTSVKVADTLNRILDVLSDGSDTTSTDTAESKVYDSFQTLLDQILNLSDNVETPDAALLALQVQINTLNHIANYTDNLVDNKKVSNLSDKSGSIMNLSRILLNKISDPDDIRENALEVIMQAVNVAEATLPSTSQETIGANTLERETNELIQDTARLLASTNVDNTDISRSGGTTTATVDMDILLASNGLANQAFDDLFAGLTDANLVPNKEDKQVAVVNVPAQGQDNNYEVKLPANDSIFADLDEVTVKTPFASVTFDKESFDNGSADQISLAVKKVDPASLTADQQASVPDGSTIIDISVYVGSEKLSELPGQVKVSIPYKLKAGEQADHITIFYLADDGTVTPMVGKFDGVHAIFFTNHFSTYFIDDSIKTFSDDNQKAWAQDAIQVLAGKEIIKGVTIDKFNPTANIKRAEFVALIVRTLDLQSEPGDTVPFTDVKPTDWYYKELAIAYRYGFVNGKTAEIFDPKGVVTRQQMAAMLARALVSLGYLPNGNEEILPLTDDNTIADYAKNAVAMNIRLGVMNGYPNLSFGPKRNATRAEAAVAIYRFLNNNR